MTVEREKKKKKTNVFFVLYIPGPVSSICQSIYRLRRLKRFEVMFMATKISIWLLFNGIFNHTLVDFLPKKLIVSDISGLVAFKLAEANT